MYSLLNISYTLIEIKPFFVQRKHQSPAQTSNLTIEQFKCYSIFSRKIGEEKCFSGNPMSLD